MLLSSAGAGITNGYSAVLLPQLQSNHTEIRITAQDATWIASMAPLPMAIGCIAGGVLMEKFGRKLAHLILSVPFLLGWLLISISDSLTFLLIGRFITGFCVGLLGPVSSVYIGETADPKYRGILLGGISFAVALGILISHVLGTFLHWQLTAAICAVFPLLCFLTIAFVPESPSWLLSKGHVDKARSAFEWLRGSGAAAQEEFRDLMEKQCLVNVDRNYSSWKNVHEQVTNKAFLRPLGVILVFFFVMQFSGVNIVIFYSVSIIRASLGSNGLNEYAAMLIIDTVRVFMSIVACVLLRQTGRRPLAIFSALGTAVSLGGLSLYHFLVYESDFGRMDFSWVPVVLLVAYTSFISIGLMPLPWCMTGELFPLPIRGLGSGVSAAFNFIVFFVVIQTGPGLLATIGPEGTYLVYGMVALFGAVFLYMCLPETKNQTLQQIEDGLRVAN